MRGEGSHHGTTIAIDLDPLSLLSRLATTVPPPRFHTVRYAGVHPPPPVPDPAPPADSPPPLRLGLRRR